MNDELKDKRAPVFIPRPASRAPRFLCWVLCAACAASAWASAQGPQQQQPDARKAEPAGRRQQPDAGQAPKKANARPSGEGEVSEPFDRAPIERMAGQCVRLETEAGAVEVEMLAEAAPETVRNFLNLAATGALDTTTFSRVVRGFIIQGGNLTTRERLTPGLVRRAGRTVPDEPNAVKHVRGVVSMARTDEPNSATTHFFILSGDGPHLDGTFAAFGRVRAGMEVVDAINQAPAEAEQPAKPVRIKRATVAPCAAPAPTPAPAEAPKPSRTP